MRLVNMYKSLGNVLPALDSSGCVEDCRAQSRRWLGVLRKGLACALVAITCAQAHAQTTVITRNQLPLASDHSWDMGPTEVRFILSDAVVVQGTATYALQDSAGDVSFITNDSQGLRLHGFDTADGRISLREPVLLADAIAEIGDSKISSGSALVDFGIGTATLQYEATSSFVDFDSFSVPAGAFDTVRLAFSVRIFGNVNGVPFDETASENWWLSEGLGFVSIAVIEDGGAPEIVDLVATNVDVPPSPDNVLLVASVLPGSRSGTVGSVITAFATMINAGRATGTNCGLSPASAIAGQFSYQAGDASNNPIAAANSPVNMAPGAVQSFVFAITPFDAFDPAHVELSFDCDNADPAPIQIGLDTLLLSAATTPVADVVALGRTVNGNGILELPNASGSAAFSVATVNVGAGDSIEASADTGDTSLPVTFSMCETHPTTGACINPTTPTSAPISTFIGAGETPTFAIFAKANGSIGFDPAGKRVFVRFRDASGVVRGATSVAVQTGN